MQKRIVCLDVGERRIGVAVSDPLGITAQGVETIQVSGKRRDIARVREICAQYDTDRVLIGLPRSLSGQEGPQAEKIRAFGQRVEAAGLQVKYWDERLTTVSATRTLLEANVSREKRRQVVDKLAATYILEAFMESGGWKEEPAADRDGEEIHMSKDDNITNIPNEDEELDMDREDIVELVDEDGNEVTFEHIMTLEHKGRSFILLAPLEPMEDVAEDEMVILEIETDEDGNDYYASVEDEALVQEVFEEYLEIAEADE